VPGGGKQLDVPSNQGKLAALFCLLLLACEHSSAGKLFEWVDSSGTTQYSDRAPSGLPFTEKTVSPASGAARPGNETGIRKAEYAVLENARQQDSEIVQARQAAAQRIEQRKLHCRQARTLYHEATHRPRSAGGGGDFKEKRLKMKVACD
jgi:Domain of unknown function (DUF4124)